MRGPVAITLLLLLGTATLIPVGCRSARGPMPSSSPRPLAGATQLVVVTTAGWDATTGDLRRFARSDTGAEWHPEGTAVPIVIGRTGLAWGVGFDELAAAEAGTSGPRKREGDGRSPAGIFEVESAFGFPPADSMGWVRLPYLGLTPTSDCVDDTASAHYNSVIDRSDVARVDWQSAEHMRQIPQYRLGAIIGYNTSPAVRGRGSCIFFHIWSGPGSTTAGCTALDERNLTELVGWLDTRARPVVVQLPASVYLRLSGDWGLPALSR